MKVLGRVGSVNILLSPFAQAVNDVMDGYLKEIWYCHSYLSIYLYLSVYCMNDTQYIQ